MKCPKCKRETKQFMASCRGNLTRRYFRCEKCKSIFIEFLYVPFTYDIYGEKFALENVIGDVTGLKEGEVFKVKEIKHRAKTYQSTLC